MKLLLNIISNELHKINYISKFSLVSFLSFIAIYFFIYYLFIKLKSRKALQFILALPLSYFLFYSYLSIIAQLFIYFELNKNVLLITTTISFSIVDMLLIYILGKNSDYINAANIFIIGHLTTNLTIKFIAIIYLFTSILLSYYGDIFRFIYKKRYGCLYDNLPWES
ncbi:putative membrane protein [Clostridium argentinense CDC 2741]|uniref:Putative membrane protein n=1 Tax=Clostridium argentinense CDC 2741 TaxID=1418104 RepID=A0A0C1TV53_9CLOT|nr:hypothetical protein RSJ17_00590 [Clostridium argentinense]KIE44614.1 putative membrane protein [Clostridium argentinense CDC 2741]